MTISIMVYEKKIQEIFAKFQNLKIMIIGDSMIDAYTWGHVHKISPEAPVPVMQVFKKEKRLGGAANVALNLKAMGSYPILCSVIGYDKNGEKFLSLLKKNQLDTTGILQSHRRNTTIKERVIAKNQHVLRIDQEDEYAIDPVEENALIAYFKEKISVIDAIIFQDYDKGGITPLLIQKITQMAKRNNIPVMVDPKHKNFLHYKNVDLFKPNLLELSQGMQTKMDVHKEKHFNDVVETFMQKNHLKKILVTLSADGVYINNTVEKKEKYWIKAHTKSVVDVSGAGDTVISIATLCTTLQLPTFWVAYIANLAGSMACEKFGVVSITHEALQNMLLKDTVLQKLWTNDPF